jgi:hypothetical protein
MEQNGRSFWVSPSITLNLCGDDAFNILEKEIGPTHVSG